MKIGFVGLGDMGLPMARRLLRSGNELCVWNRSSAKTGPLVAEGAIAAESPATLLEQSDLAGLCLTSDIAVEEVAFGPKGLFEASHLSGKAIADFSTGSADAAIRFSRRASTRNVHWVDAPVSGGVPAAIAGSLIVMAGGTTEALSQLTPLLSAVSARVSHMGPSGSGQISKLCNQLIVSTNLLIIAESIALARKAGVEVSRLVEAFRGGFADSAPLQIFGPRMVAHCFEPRLGAVALMRKDVALAYALATRCSAETPMLKQAVELYACPDLDGAADISSLIEIFEKVNR